MRLKKQRHQRDLTNYRLLVGLLGMIYLALGGSVRSEQPQGNSSEVFESQLSNQVEPGPVLPNKSVVSNHPGTPAENPESVNVRAENDLFITQNPRTPIQRDLWKARISTLSDLGINQPKNELEKIIQQINSIEIRQDAAVTDIETPLNPELQEAILEPQPQEAQNPSVAQVEKIHHEDTISEQTLNQFKELSQSPEILKNPLKLAEILYKGNCLQESAVCYREALKRINTTESDVFQDKAWILLQLGNCLTKTDPQAALENYQIVITEFPYSPWAQLAKGKSDLISWYLKDEPQTLIETSKVEIAR